METNTNPTEEQFRQAFRKFNVLMVGMWRLGFGRWINIWPSVIGRIMVITHTGRKSGLRRKTPVNYAQIDGDLYCTAGFGHVSDWYRNILADPNVEVWLPGSWQAGLAEDISDHKNRSHLLRRVMVASGFAAPMFGVDPREMDDRELVEATREYRLIRIRPTEHLSGPGGPGDLAWVWLPVIGFLVLIGSMLIKYAVRKTK